jgi:hypothetical protein
VIAGGGFPSAPFAARPNVNIFFSTGSILVQIFRRFLLAKHRLVITSFQSILNFAHEIPDDGTRNEWYQNRDFLYAVFAVLSRTLDAVTQISLQLIIDDSAMTVCSGGLLNVHYQLSETWGFYRLNRFYGFYLFYRLNRLKQIKLLKAYLFFQNRHFLSSPEFSFKAVFDSAELCDYFEDFWLKIVSGVLLTF